MIAPAENPSPLLAAALGYLSHQCAVFPCWEVTPDSSDCACPRTHPSRDAAGHCGSPGKHPRTPNGVKDATTDPATVTRWWSEWPRAHLAIACGPSGLLVVDVDPRNGGDASLSDLEARYGPFPDTPRQLTGGGGLHLLLARPNRPHVRGPRHGLGRGIDLKADGGYIIAAPSGHRSGRPYTFELGCSLDDLPVADAPAWLVELLDTRPVHATPTSAAVREGLLGRALEEAGWLGPPLGPDKSAARCPREDDHSTGSRWNGSTIVYAPQRPAGPGWFHCSHSHCTDLTTQSVLAALPPDAVARARTALGIREDAPAPTDADTPPAPSPRLQPIGKRTRAGAGDVCALLTSDPLWAGTLAHDTFADRIRWLRPLPPLAGVPRPSVGSDLADEHLTYLLHWVAQHRGWTIGPDTAHAACLAAAHATPVHPLRDYLESLAWDGSPRLTTWLQRYAGAPDSPTTSLIGIWTLIAAVARILAPGCQADHMLILEGPQGAGKSSLIRALAGPYFLPQLPNLASDHAAHQLQGHWLVEVGELDAFRGIASSRIKDFLSRPVDVYRPPYARTFHRRPRQCLFIGTTNDDAYLHDASGARRFWPVTTTTLDPVAATRDRNQLWAEAVSEFRAGTPWWPSPTHGPALAEAQNDRFDTDPWEPLVLDYIAPLPHVSSTEILDACLHVPQDRWKGTDAHRVTDILKRAGWSRRGSARPRRWFAP